MTRNAAVGYARVSTDEQARENNSLQRYVSEHYPRLGFSKISGPFDRGPDFHVLQQKRWQKAEVETRWQNYLAHGHQHSSAFGETKYLIILSPKDPPAEVRDQLPPEIVHIDLEHFLEWYEAASQVERIEQRNSTRIDVIAGEMQGHWVTICSDNERDMAACPDCDGCPYFGEGLMDGEAHLHFHKLAAHFMVQHAIADGLEANLTKLQEADLKRFVEMHPPV